MYSLKKNVLLIVISMVCVRVVQGTDFVTIVAPAVNATVSGMPLLINGTSSQANAQIKLTINTTQIGSATTDGSGDWNFTLNDLYDGNYTIIADLLSDTFEVLATSSNPFTVSNSPTINIISPIENEVVFLNPSTASGGSSLASTTVQISIDSVPVTTTTTDTDGNWQASYPITTNGNHTLLAELKVAGNTVASTSVDFNASVSLLFPSGMSQMIILSGDVPTSGSGNGSGYTYSTSGSTVTITFSPALASVPVVVATGQYASGDSTVTIASVSNTAVNLSFSAGTENVHFVAMILA